MDLTSFIKKVGETINGFGVYERKKSTFINNTNICGNVKLVVNEKNEQEKTAKPLVNGPISFNKPIIIIPKYSILNMIGKEKVGDLLFAKIMKEKGSTPIYSTVSTNDEVNPLTHLLQKTFENGVKVGAEIATPEAYKAGLVDGYELKCKEVEEAKILARAKTQTQ